MAAGVLEGSVEEHVSVALNGVSFETTGEDVRFDFVGLHTPALIHVYFTTAANKLILQFDSQAAALRLHTPPTTAVRLYRRSARGVLAPWPQSRCRPCRARRRQTAAG